jgi:hypothetical protein
MLSLPGHAQAAAVKSHAEGVYYWCKTASLKLMLPVFHAAACEAAVIEPQTGNLIATQHVQPHGEHPYIL